MALLFLYPLRESIGVFNVFGYISFRAAMAAVTAMIIGVVVGPVLIRWLRQLRIGQTIRGEGIKELYEKHKGKAGTPTMGGILILFSILISTLLWGNLSNKLVVLVIIVTLLLGFLGMIDDYQKLRKKMYRGLRGRDKLLVQFAIGGLLGLYFYLDPLTAKHAHEIPVPFLKNTFIWLGLLYIPFVAIVITGASNAVNLTDGLDGLASGCVIMAASAFTVLAYIVGRTDWSVYLAIPFVPETGELTVFCAALVGATMSFLWFNAHPAEVFMGDTGSLSLGGALGVIAVMLKQELLLLIIGGVFVIEALSVMIQVASYRLRGGKRVFLMAPIHHHFEMLGWPESKIITRFWIVAAVLALFGLATLKIR
ncbi:MAG TPA: phospho-N-acetylmuramoyl-pentapeptide-transferase [bacterium]|nr:phospho-N-acetylmuramoyl-pentapeptide-transferase [bacterium]HQO33400.1 phospho-N-acetylmuramoyl-pentapeptide-transferase [bacterium]HQP98633.1 phospho-N-acetylmuramoyl-pentapeptide-transferase [bacterium]